MRRNQFQWCQDSPIVEIAFPLTDWQEKFLVFFVSHLSPSSQEYSPAITEMTDP